MQRRTQKEAAYSPLLVRLVNIRTRGQFNLAQGGQVIRAGTLVAIHVHAAITLKVGNRIYGGVHWDLLYIAQRT